MSHNLYYILTNRKPYLCQDIQQWAQWYETADRTVAYTRIGDTQISTVFLGIDHGPLLFETMIFGWQFTEDPWRCSTWKEAERQYREACDLVRRASN